MDLHNWEEVSTVTRTIQGYHWHHRCELNSPWQKNIVLAPSSTSDFATLCESPVSSSAEQSIDLHTLDEVSLVRTIQGYHRHHRCQVNSPWQKNIVLAPSPTSDFATTCESPVSSSAQQCMDLHNLEEVSTVRTIQGYHWHHRWLVKDPWESIFSWRRILAHNFD